MEYLSLARLKTIFTSRGMYSVDRDQYWQNNWQIILLSLVLFVAVLLWRSWPNFSHPGLYAEDTSHYFNYFYGDSKDFSAIFHHPNGYQVILTNFIAKLVAKLDVRLQPTAYMVIGAPLAILSVMLLSLSGFIKNKYMIFLSPFVLGLSGLNHLYYYITLAYQIYTFVIILIGLLLIKPLNNKWLNGMLFALMSLLIFSGPYSVLVVPFSVCFIMFFKGKTKLLLALCAIAFLYAFTLTEHTIQLRFLFKPIIYPVWLNTLIGRVFFMDLFGGTGPYKILASIIFFVFIFALLRKDIFYLKIAIILLVLINSSLAALFLSNKFYVALKIRPCYLVIAQFLWLAFLLFTCDRLLTLRKKLYHGGLVICCLAALFVFYDNQKVIEKRSVQMLPSLPIFLQKIYEAERQDLPGQNRVVQFEIGGRRFFHPLVRVGKVEDPTIPVEIVKFAE